MNLEDTGIRYVIDALSTLELAKRMDDYKVVIRCPICGEGHKQRTHGHCYIGLIQNGPPLVYHCFINECSGIVTPAFLREAGVEDNELASYLQVFNKTRNDNITIAERKIKYINKKKENLVIPDIEDSPNNMEKLLYICKRMKIKFSYQNMKDLKIIFSLKDFLKENELNPSHKYSKFTDVIDRDYIGFLSYDGEYIVFRNTKNNENLRYVKYDLFGSIESSNIFYNLPGVTCDLFAEDVYLNIAEGPFDVLGIFCNVRNFDRVNNLYCAVCGSNYMHTVKTIIGMGFIGNLHVNVYSDKDKKPWFYKKLYDEIKPWVKSFNLYYNNKSKDFGVSKEEIEVLENTKEFTKINKRR